MANRNANLEGIIQSQQRKIDDLVTRQADLDQRNQQLRARIDAAGETTTIVNEAKSTISSRVADIINRFRGDSDIQVEATATGYRFVLREAVLFPTGSATLTDDGRAAIQRVSDVLRGSNDRVRIEGHTDDVPVRKAESLQKFPRGNMDLSVERSLAVWDHMTKNGNVAVARLAVVGHGPHRPMVPNDSSRNRWRNRRVEILVSGE